MGLYRDRSLLCTMLVVMLMLTETAVAARTPHEAVAVMGAAATSGDTRGFLATLDPHSRAVLLALAASGDEWQRAEDTFAETFGEKFGDTLSTGEVAYGVPQMFVMVAAGERRDDRPISLKRYMREIEAIDVLRIEQGSSDARVYIRTTVRRPGSRPYVQEDTLSVNRRDGEWLVSLPFLSVMSDQSARINRSGSAIADVTRALRSGKIAERFQALQARWRAEQLLYSRPNAYR
jgi:hypothetical protein